MKKTKAIETHPHKAVIILFVSLIALMAIYSAQENATASGKSTMASEINCKTEDYCVKEEWTEELKSACVKNEFVEYKECASYSFPVDDSGNRQMTCDSWNIRYEDECLEWSEETEWELKCTDSRVKKTCY
ncbi:hypothetical protein HQ533_03475 [Candidatus Woesearchaeota archaeon]|nr:hypothetical protein [Candidatus Woesearchaeota archaeon]